MPVSAISSTSAPACFSWYAASHAARLELPHPGQEALVAVGTHFLGQHAGGRHHHPLARRRGRARGELRRERVELRDPGVGMGPPLRLHDAGVAELREVGGVVGQVQHPLPDPRVRGVGLAEGAAALEDPLHVLGVALELRHVHAVHAARMVAVGRLHHRADVLRRQPYQVGVAPDEVGGDDLLHRHHRPAPGRHGPYMFSLSGDPVITLPVRSATQPWSSATSGTRART